MSTFPCGSMLLPRVCRGATALLLLLSIIIVSCGTDSVTHECALLLNKEVRSAADHNIYSDRQGTVGAALDLHEPRLASHTYNVFTSFSIAPAAANVCTVCAQGSSFLCQRERDAPASCDLTVYYNPQEGQFEDETPLPDLLKQPPVGIPIKSFLR
jgi:hypothetical protein